MNVLVATWYDELGSPFMYEHYMEGVVPDELFLYYIAQKHNFGKKVIAQKDNYVVFSDGNRVVLTIEKLYSEIGEAELYAVKLSS